MKIEIGPPFANGVMLIRVNEQGGQLKLSHSKYQIYASSIELAEKALQELKKRGI